MIPDIPNFDYNPNPPILPSDERVNEWLENGVSDEEYERLVGDVEESCSGGSGDVLCYAATMALNKALFVINQDEVLIDLWSPEATGQDPPETLFNIENQPEVTASAIGALLIPYLLVKWGSTLLHNTFPRSTSGYPTITDNIASLSVTFSATGDTGDSSAPTGEGGGSNTASMTLNGHLRDEHGQPIRIDVDGAPLVIIWAYPNTTAVRRITLIPKSISDKYFNEESTTVEFKGVETSIGRFASQRIYSEGLWGDKVEDTFKEYCKDLGFSEEECVLHMPEDYDPTGTILPEQVQTTDNLSHLHYLVESIGGCRLVFSADGSIATDGVEATVDCEDAMEVKEDSLTSDYDFKTVENAMWLGPELVETLSISGELQDNSTNTGTSGPGCSGTPNQPRNEILTKFSTCGYKIDAAEGYQDKKRDNHWQVRLTKDGEEAPSIPTPFKGTIGEVVDSCESTPELMNCNGGLGNTVSITSLEDGTEGQTWVFYHLGEVLVSGGQTVDVNKDFAVVGRSGEIDKPRMSFYIEKEGEVVLEEASAKEYLNTLSSDCSTLNVSKDFIKGGFTSETVCPAGAQHIHVQYKNAPGFSEEVTNMLQSVFDNTATAHPDLCLDLNCAPGQSCGECYKVGDRNQVLSCIDAHSHSSNWGWACDFWIGESRTAGNTENLPVPNPFPNVGYNTLIADYGGGSCGMGYTVLWDNGVEYFHLDPWLGEGSEGNYAGVSGSESPTFPVLEGLDAEEEEEEPVDPSPEISVDEPTAPQSEWLDMPACQYTGLSDSRAEIINRVGKELGYNPQLLAQMLQIESGFDPSNHNTSSGAYGLFQCIEEGDGKCSEIFKCGDANTDETFECQLRALPHYYDTLGCPAAEKPEFLYRCISTPACINEPDNTPLSTWYSQSTIDGNAWFDENGEATCRGISWAARDLGCLDPRLSSEGFRPTGSTPSSSCTSKSQTQTLNAAAVDGTGLTGIGNVKYGQEVKLSAEFGIRPRNIYLAPVSPGGTPQYVLLTDAVNEKGFIDWKIKSVTYNVLSTWRISLEATRSGEQAPELPRALKPPRNMNEWIRYYWYPDPEREAQEFIRVGTAEFDEDGALTNAYDDTVAQQDRFASSEVGRSWEAVQSAFHDYEEEPSDEHKNEIDSAVREFHNNCEQAAYNGCLDVVEDFDTSEFDSLLNEKPLANYFRTEVYIPTKEKSETFGVDEEE